MFQGFEDDEDPGIEVASFLSQALFAELVVPALITQAPAHREADLLTRAHRNRGSYTKNGKGGLCNGDERNHGVVKNRGIS